MVEYLTLPHRKLFLVILLLIPSIISSDTAFGQQTDIAILTINEAGEPADRWTYQPDISWNGEFAVWSSPADNLVENDKYDGSDIYIRDKNGLISLISVNSHAVQSNGWSFDPAISADSRYIAFASLASNLQNKYSIPDTNGLADIYLHDRNRYTTERISVSTSGQQVTGWSKEPSISSDGRYIVYTSSASDIVAGDDNNFNDLYLYDHLTKDVRIISRSSENQAANGHSFNPSISSLGRYIAFISNATNLSPDAKPGIFLYDQVDRNLIKIPFNIESSNPNQEQRISKPALSGDGAVLVFSTTDGTKNTIYSYEFVGDKLESIFSSSSEQDTHYYPIPVDVSDGGRFVVYPGKQFEGSQVLHVYDRETTKINELTLDRIIENNSIVVALRVSPDGGEILIQSVDSSTHSELQNKNTINYLYSIRNDFKDNIASQVYGWVSDGSGLPLSGVDILVKEERFAKTDQRGDFKISGLSRGTHTLAPAKKGYVFEPQNFLLSYTNPMASPPESASFIGIPEGVIEAARHDIGMPYSLERGCDSPFTPCEGPFHGYFSGDCTDLIIDAYRYGADFHLGWAIEWDAYINPWHYYRWRDARNSHDMWRYFAYSGQLLSHEQMYLPGDIVFFDWDEDGISDHVAMVSEINRKNRPLKIIDATGYIDENPDGLAIEMEWKSYHNTNTQGHARWNGASSIKHADEQEGDKLILIALDSPAAALQIINAPGLTTDLTAANIPHSQYWEYGSSSVISIAVPLSSTPFYIIELSSSIDTDIQLGIQTIQGGQITQNYSYSSEMSTEEELIIPLEIEVQDGQLGFAEPTITQD